MSCLVVYLRRPRVLRILTGPPFHRESDAAFARLALPGTGADAVVVCGGTSANILQRELGVRVEMDLSRIRDAGDLPPPGRLPGIGLATEGVLTLARVRTALETDADWRREALAAREILSRMRDADRVEFCVGTKINEAHQDPNLPSELDLHRTVVRDIASLLSSRWRKQTSIRWYWNGTGAAIFFALKKLGILRVRAKTELKGLDLVEHGQDAYASFQFFSNTWVLPWRGAAVAAPRHGGRRRRRGIVLLRPTQSAGLFVQMVGRGFRLSPETGKADCLVLDYGGNIERHGPVDAVRIREPGQGPKRDEPLAKECPNCREMVHPAVMLCPKCGYEWPRRTAAKPMARLAAT